MSLFSVSTLHGKVDSVSIVSRLLPRNELGEIDCENRLRCCDGFPSPLFLKWNGRRGSEDRLDLDF